MKKLRLITTFMATTACVVPAIPSLVTLTSCSNGSISEVALKIKDDTIQTFIKICKETHRSVWNEQEAFDYVVSTMNSLGFRHEAGRDYWSYVPEVSEQITKETGIERSEWNFPTYGNIWYDLPATEGMEDAPKVILQAHMDSQMTFADDAAKQNWLKNGVNVTYDRDNDIIYTDGKTSLGADGGMGIAMLLSIAKYTNNFKHGGIRLLFTAGESEATEHYAAGASFLVNDQNYMGIDPYDPNKKTYMLPNSKKPFGDTPNEFTKVVSISGLYNKTIYRSVGGISEVCFSDDQLSLAKDENKVSKEGNHLYTITIDNLHGGKSSKDINSGYANALEMMMKTLDFDETSNMQIISASSQPGAYNIAKTATATFVSSLTLDQLNEKKNTILNTFKQLCKGENWNSVKFEITQLNDDEIGKGNYIYGLTTDQTSNLIEFFSSDLEWGAVEWFDEDHKNVKKSFNHGKLSLSVAQNASNTSSLQFYTILRDNEETNIEEWDGYIGAYIKNRFKHLYGEGESAEKSVQDHLSHIINPPWQGTQNNKLIDLIVEGYKKLNITPKVTDNHGWVEVGCLPNGYREISHNMEMACLGIEINNSQETSESVYTDSLNTLNKALLYTLSNINKSI